MKIIHILHHSLSPFKGQFSGSLLRYNSGFPMVFAKEMRKRYPDIELECWRPECSLNSEFQWYDKKYSINHRVFPSSYLRYGWELSVPLLRAAEETKSRDCCFIIHGSYNLHAYILGKLLENSPTILQSHGGLPALARMKRSEQLWLKPLFLSIALIERQTLPHYRHMFSISRKEKKEVGKIFPRLNVSFSPMGIDFNFFSPGDKHDSRELIGLDQKSQIVLYVGRLVPEKGIEYLLGSISNLASQLSLLRLYIIGGGPKEEALRNQSKELGINDYVHFVGYVSQDLLVNWYRAADVTCLPSLYEGYGMALAESMACGTPVVASSEGGSKDIVFDFDCGELIPPRDTRALTEAILKIFNGSTNTIPDILRARNTLDWTSKLQFAIEQLKSVSSVKN